MPRHDPVSHPVTFGRDIDQLRREMEDLLSHRWQVRRPGGQRGFRPAVDVYRTDQPPLLTIVCDLAGVDPADLELSVGGGVLSIAGVRRRPSADQVLYQQIELDWGPFERRIAVGEDVDSDRAEASLDRGLLTVKLPLVPQPPSPARVLITVVRKS